MKPYKMAVSFKLSHADFPSLLNSTLCLPLLACFFCIVFVSIYCCIIRFCPGKFALKHLCNQSLSYLILLVYVICKSVVSFEPIAVNVNFAPVSMWQCVNVVRSIFFHPHVSFITKTLFTTVNLVCHVTVYNVKPVNSAHHIHIVFPYMYYTTSINRHLTYRTHETVTSSPMPLSNLLSSPGIKSHLSPLALDLNLSPRSLYPPGPGLLWTFNMCLCVFIN